MSRFRPTRTEIFRRAVRARLWNDRGQQPAAHPASLARRRRRHAHPLKGAEHEFSSLPGVMEDVTDIILNVKSLIVKLDADDPRRCGSRQEGRPDHGGMIEADPSITVVNKDLVIATLTEDVRFEMTLTVSKGRGMSPARRTSRTTTSRRSA
jgi:hypothetical protein